MPHSTSTDADADTRYEEAMALARQMASERDARFEQLKASEVEADALRRVVARAKEHARQIGDSDLWDLLYVPRRQNGEVA